MTTHAQPSTKESKKSLKIKAFLKKYAPIIEGYRLSDEPVHFGTSGAVAKYKNGPQIRAVKFPRIDKFEGSELEELNDDQKEEHKLLQELSGAKSSLFLQHLASNEIKAGNKKLRYIMMEFAPFGNLSSYLRKNPTLSLRERQSIATQMTNCVYKMHELGIYSRDIKPENFLVFKDQKGRIRVKISDLGGGTRNKLSPEERLTPKYEPPEFHKGFYYNCERLDNECLVIALADVLDPVAFKKLDRKTEEVEERTGEVAAARLRFEGSKKIVRQHMSDKLNEALKNLKDQLNSIPETSSAEPKRSRTSSPLIGITSSRKKTSTEPNSSQFPPRDAEIKNARSYLDTIKQVKRRAEQIKREQSYSTNSYSSTGSYSSTSSYSSTDSYGASYRSR